MEEGQARGQLTAIILSMAILVAPFIALLIRVEAGLIVMALALAAGSLLLREVLDAASIRSRRWVHLAILVNLALAAMCVGLTAWLVSGH
jgi:uncharacterized metal-binding protein